MYVGDVDKICNHNYKLIKIRHPSSTAVKKEKYQINNLVLSLTTVGFVRSEGDLRISSSGIYFLTGLLIFVDVPLLDSDGDRETNRCSRTYNIFCPKGVILPMKILPHFYPVFRNSMRHPVSCGIRHALE